MYLHTFAAISLILPLVFLFSFYFKCISMKQFYHQNILSPFEYTPNS